MTESMGVGRAYLRAARYFRDDWGKILFSTILIGLNTLARLGQPFPYALMIDAVISGQVGGDWIHRLFHDYAPSSKIKQIVLLAVATVLLRGLQELLGLWQGVYNLRIGFNGLLRVRCDLYRKLQALSLSYHRNRPQGDAIYRLSWDTAGVQGAFNVVQSMFVNVCMLVFMAVIMLSFNWKLGLCAIAVMPILYWTMKAYGSVLIKSSTGIAVVESELTTTVQRSVNSIGLIQAFGREDDEYAHFRGNVERSNRAWMRMHMHSMIYWLVIGMSFGCGTALILGYGGWLAYQFTLGAHNGMTIGFLGVYLAFLAQLYDPLQKLSGSGVDLHRGMAGMLRVYEVLDTESTVRDDPHAIALPRQPRVLALEHASFEYSPQARVLDDVSVTIRPGEMVAFVGPSGVGKSSLLNLLPRFYDPTAGRLTLDGHDLRKIKLRDLRQHIALVLQEYAILPTTVAENIAYGVPAAPTGTIRKAAELAGADGFIEVLPQKYATVLTENGQNLSGGQRQRISIARALATEAPILVLDEPTSALDAYNEQMITETLRSLKSKRTIILVSHRLSTVFDCDRIFVMDAGKIVEQGTHEQLLAMGGAYYRMAQHQLKLGDSGEAAPLEGVAPATPGPLAAIPVASETAEPMSRDYDVIIIGGGHAGAEAAWAAAGLGASVALVTFAPTRIGAMSCNPAIGGLAKGQMVREIDALGGLMGLATDATGIQFRMLNRSKGPAVWGPRAQSDKYRYAAEVQRLLADRPGLQILAGEVDDIVVDPPSRRIAAVTLKNGRRLDCRAVVVTTGTFLRALMHTGESQTPGGRVGESAATGLSGCLTRLGLELGRLKTGTPPRLSRASIDFNVFDQQPGDDEPMPFSFLNEYGVIENSRDATRRASSDTAAEDARPVGSRLGGAVNPWKPPLPQVHCWLSATNAAIHDLIRDNLHRAPMYSGQISSIGPRYCPSIEDKVVRFADKPAHQIFLEPEGLDTDEIYCNGISTSLPADVQEKIIRLIPGLEKAKILRFGYAVEYDMVWPSQIRSTLETKKVPGLFLAGQINGTSGYEEAAAQGLVAGINAALLAAGKETDFVLRRDQAYIGVLVDDLTTKPPIEPYRMFTSRAEHRLHLRSDNADARLTPLGRDIGFVDDTRWSAFQDRQHRTGLARSLLTQLRVGDSPAIDFLRQSQVTWESLLARAPEAAAISADIGRQIDISLKYEGYIARQDRLIAQQSQWEQKLIPPTFDYSALVGLRNEARQKLTKFTPRSLGQALRISGVTPADVTVLAIHLENRKRQESTR